MKHYDTLIKLKKRELDQLRKQLASLREQQHALEQQRDDYLASLEHERQLAENMTDMGGFFGNYSQSIKENINVIAQQIALLEQQQQLLAEKIRLSFGDQKKYEIALERKLADIAYHERQQEQHIMDEIAGQRHAQ